MHINNFTDRVLLVDNAVALNRIQHEYAVHEKELLTQD